MDVLYKGYVLEQNGGEKKLIPYCTCVRVWPLVPERIDTSASASLGAGRVPLRRLHHGISERTNKQMMIPATNKVFNNTVREYEAGDPSLF
jgi:hypothetical protein